MATTEAQFVVCGPHEIRYSAASRCPECSNRGTQGTAPAAAVEVVRIER